MTNSEHFRRHFRCSAGAETLIHLFRDCVHSKQIWCRLIPPSLHPAFFAEPTESWTFKCLCSAFKMGLDFDDDILFAMTTRRQVINAQFIKSQALQVQGSKHRKAVGGLLCPRSEVMIRWLKPPEGWHLLNTDGILLQLASSGIEMVVGLEVLCVILAVARSFRPKTQLSFMGFLLPGIWASEGFMWTLTRL
ncbi:hypothetical protein V2J09_013095 [Rumex salicifolius]